MALWDLLGKSLSEPVWKLLGYSRSFTKLPYASQLFGDTPQETYARAVAARNDGYGAVKFGWGPIGANLKLDLEHFSAAREGLGKDRKLMVDFGQIFGEDVNSALARMKGLEEAEATWIEEPFHTYALAPYASLARSGTCVRTAGGEGAHHPAMARNLIDFGAVGFIQIDCGRIGGIGPAKQIADYARSKGVTYVNHTFTSHLALSASLQPFAGLADHEICEYPVALKPLAVELTANHLQRDSNGRIAAPDAPGLGMTVDTEALRKYLVEVDIKVRNESILPRAAL
jgi:L-alanine-DL-glutamate epimerase-like enolase superfamily enzyme